jgi:hypothetical protein
MGLVENQQIKSIVKWTHTGKIIATNVTKQKEGRKFLTRRNGEWSQGSLQ